MPLPCRTPVAWDPSTPVAFLDFDGVITTPESYARAALMGADDPIDKLDPELIARVADFAEEASAAIVISSAWRGQLGPALVGVTYLAEVLFNFGLDAPVIGWTPMIPGKAEKVREAEIEAWIAMYAPASYVIIDDIPMLSARSVRTVAKKGFQEEDRARALQILKGS